MTRGRGAVLAVLLLGFAAGCSRTTDQPKRADSAAAGRPALFTVAPQQLSQLRITRVRATSWTAEVRTTGTVDWDGEHTTQVITQVSGPITRIRVDLGDRVKAGFR